jgi:hypothetical protein
VVGSAFRVLYISVSLFDPFVASCCVLYRLCGGAHAGGVNANFKHL